MALATNLASRHLKAGPTVEIREIEINRIHPNCRLVYDADIIQHLCHDIESRGLQEPILVELVGYWFQIIDGEKRWRACKKIGLNKIKAIILEVYITEAI